MKKLSWEFIDRTLPNIDHPEVNMIRNSHGQMIDVAVNLYKGDVSVLKVTVMMHASSAQLTVPALWLLMKDLEKYNIDLDWDRALLGSGLFCRASCEKLMNEEFSSFIGNMKKYEKENINVVFNDASNDLARASNSNDNKEIEDCINSGIRKFITFFQIKDYEIISSDFDRLKKENGSFSNIIKRICTGFHI